MNSFIPIVTILCITSLSGCATFQAHRGMENVKIQSEERISGTVLWRTGSSEDELVEARLNELLALELTGADVSQIGLLNNYDLQATYENLGLAQSELVQAGLLSNPVLSVERRFKGEPAAGLFTFPSWLPFCSASVFVFW